MPIPNKLLGPFDRICKTHESEFFNITNAIGKKFYPCAVILEIITVIINR